MILKIKRYSSVINAILPLKSNMFDPYTFDYKTYIEKQYNLTESPVLYRDFPFSNDDWITNSESSIKIEKKSKLLGIYNYGNFKFRIYEYLEDGDSFIDLMDENSPTVYMHHSYSEISIDNMNGIINHSIWNSRNMRGLARDWVFNTILKKYEFIMSDGVHTPKGKLYWSKLFDEGLEQNYKCGTIDIKTNNFTLVNSIDNLDDAYHDKKADIRLIIFRR